MEHDHLIVPDRPDNWTLRENTLLVAHWKSRACDIFRRDGIDEIIIRRNNRTRRRGFRDIYMFYILFQRAPIGEQPALDGSPEPERNSRQGELFEELKVAAG